MDFALWVMYFVAIYFAVHWLLVILENKIRDEARSYNGEPLVTIVIPAWNEEASIVGTIKSVLKLNYPKEKIQLLIVDDASTDNTEKIIKEFVRNLDFNIKYIKHNVNMGKGAALNTALKHAEGEFFICLDADSFVMPEALKSILPYFYSEEVACVLPLIKLKKVKGFALHLQYVEYLVNFFLKKVMGLLDCIHVTPGPFAVYRKNALIKVKGFDVDNLTEDLEMALRLQKNDYKIIQLMKAKVLTLAPDNMRGWFRQRNRWYKGTLLNLHKHKDMFFKKRYGEFGLFQLPMVLGAALLSIFFAFFVVGQHMIKPLINKIYDISFINFNVGFVSSLWMERFSFLDFSYMILFFSFIVLSFGVAWIAYAFRHTNETFSKKGLVSSATFMVIYPFFLSFVWMGVIFDLVRKKKQKW